MEFWEWLESEIERQGLTRYALAKKANLPHNTVQEIIRSKRFPRVDTAEKIQAALGVRYPGIGTGEENLPDIGQRIKKARGARGLTPAGLAKKAGISRAKLADWESGNTEPSDEELARVLDALKVSYEGLLKEYDEGYVAERIRKDKTDADDIRTVLAANPHLEPADIEVIMRIVESKEREVRDKEQGAGG